MAVTSKFLSTGARCLGCSAVVLVAGLMLLPSAAVVAQVPPEIVPSSTTTAPPGPTTTVVPVVVPEEPLTPPGEAPPQPGTTIFPAPLAEPEPTPAPTAAPAPTPPTSRATTVTMSPRRTPTPLAVGISRAFRETASRSSALAGPPDAPEAGQGEEQVVKSLPFTPGGRAGAPGAMELGVQDGLGRQVASLASVAAGLIATVLLGVVLWLQRQVRLGSR